MKIQMLRLLAALSLAGGVAAWSGCGAKEKAEEAATPPADQAQAEGEAAPAEGEGHEESTTDTFVIDMSQPASPADYDAAVKKQDYTQATDVLLRMNAQNVQGADTLNRMRQLQDDVARAAASGDPKARQAAEMLRRLGRMPSAPSPQ